MSLKIQLQLKRSATQVLGASLLFWIRAGIIILKYFIENKAFRKDPENSNHLTIMEYTTLQ